MNRPRDVGLGEFSTAFLPMAALLLWALWTPEFGDDLDVGRTRLTIWATTILLVPALVLFPFRGLGQRVANLCYLFWTAAWVAFALHAYWAVFIVFDGVADTFRQQGRLIAGGNFLLLGLWTLDVALLWLLRAGPPATFQWGVRLLAVAIFAFTLVVLRGGSVQVLGFVFVGLLALAALVRLGTEATATRGTAAD